MPGVALYWPPATLSPESTDIEKRKKLTRWKPDKKESTDRRLTRVTKKKMIIIIKSVLKKKKWKETGDKES